MARRAPAPAAMDRAVALAGRPQRTAVHKRREETGGELRLTLRFDRPGWQTMLGAGRKSERAFVLDALGREVYEQCDGKRSVSALVGAFATAHKVSRAEAEHSVTQYLRMLMRKGLIAMEMDRETT